MRVVDRLNALDERAGVGRTASARQWNTAVRLWWLGSAMVTGTFLLGLLVLSLTGKPYLLTSMAAMAPALFWSGFLYNERLRSLGRRPVLTPVPPNWPNETT